MTKRNMRIAKYLFYSFPAVLLLLVWGIFQNQRDVITMDNGLVYALWEILSWHLIIWFIAFIYILVASLVLPGFRDELLAKLAGIKERDERESLIVGKAGKSAFLSTLALLIFLLFLSTVEIRVSKLPPEKAINGKQHELSIGFAFRSVESEASIRAGGGHLVYFHGVPLSQSELILVIILWNMGWYYFFSRKYAAI